ncbi:hypothetical protein [Streptomyces sp. WZ-12]|uniref:hypothetical protein n=1 Tax=Streptomyces sp. WZ-12 TaxID=3030210 RepID=UPI002380F611|nr:hypothetical protein [Streptomyces sp. WZ-12]
MSADSSPALLVQGGHELRGELRVPGFKHAFVTVLAGALTGRSAVTIDNCPAIEETRVLLALAQALGARVHENGRRVLVDPSGLTGQSLDPQLVDRIHGAVYLLPALLARSGRVHLPVAGGCQIGDEGSGARPVRQYAEVLQRFGAEVTVGPDGSLTVRADRLTACELDLRDWTSDRELRTGPLYSGATKMAILTAASARGTTRLRHPYPKPDVTELVRLLDATGRPARYTPEGDLLIEGRPDGGHGRPVRHMLVSDLITVVTWATAAALTRSTIRLTGLTPDRLATGLAPEIAVARDMGLDWQPTADTLDLTGEPPDAPVDVTVASHGIYSDSQPFFMLLATLAPGVSHLRETVWRRRFTHVPELRRLGADIEVTEARARIRGGCPPHRPDQSVAGGDLRAAAALLLAALAVPGQVRVHGAEHLVRGYEDLVTDLVKLGAHVRSEP